MTDGAGASANDGPPARPPRAAQAVFLERQSYRRRRLVDMARLLPLLGVLLLLVPLLWPEADWAVVGDAQVAPVPMSRAITYIFAVWAVLIAGAGLFGMAARRWGGDRRRTRPGRD